MTLAVDASSPAIATKSTTAGGSLTSASFTAPTKALLVVTIECDTPSGGANNQAVSDSGGLTWTLQGRKSPNASSTGGAGTSGAVEVWSATTASSAARTVSLGTGSDTSPDDKMMSVVVFTDSSGNAPTFGAIISAFSASGTPSVALVTTAANSWVWAAITDWSQKGNATAGSGQAVYQQGDFTGLISGHTLKQSATTSVSGTSVTMNVTAPTAEQYNMLAFEIKANPGGGSNVGTLSAAVPVLTGSMAGTETDAAATSASIPRLSAAIAGTQTDAGAVAASTPVPTATLTGTQTNTAALNAAVPVVTGTIAGTATDAGASSSALPVLTGSMAGTQTNPGTLSAAVPVLKASLFDTTGNAGVVSAAVPVVTSSIQGTATNPATLAAAIPRLTSTLTDGGPVNAATLSASLPRVSSSVAGVLVNPASLTARVPVLGFACSDAIRRNITAAGTSRTRWAAASSVHHDVEGASHTRWGAASHLLPAASGTSRTRWEGTSRV